MSTSCRCGATWTGHRIEHCTQCHQTFTGTSSGDRHRTGDHAIDHGPDRRRCLTVDEMLEKGLRRNERGQWGNGGVSPWARNADSEATGAAQNGPDVSQTLIGEDDTVRPAERRTEPQDLPALIEEPA